jgi:glycosyltransferase involved in cell wall biosynthesis
MKVYLSYPEGAHPAHAYQAKSIDATIVPYTKFYNYIFKDIIVLISEGFRPMLVGSALKRFRKVNMHINIMLGDFIVGIGKYYPLKNLLKEFLDYVDVFVANSTLTSEIFLSNFGERYRQKVEVCWPLPNTKLFSKVHPSLLKYRNSGDCEREVRICYLGHLSYCDGADLLPQIFANLKRDFKNISMQMYVIGTGPLQAELLSAERNLSGC